MLSASKSQAACLSKFPEARLPEVASRPRDPRAGRDRVLAIRRSRSPEPSLIKGKNTPLASRTPSRRARTCALPVRGLLGCGRDPCRSSACNKFVTIQHIDCCCFFAHGQPHKATVRRLKRDSLISVVLPADLSHQLHRFNQRLL
jgi:hypothetical protein